MRFGAASGNAADGRRTLRRRGARRGRRARCARAPDGVGADAEVAARDRLCDAARQRARTLEARAASARIEGDAAGARQARWARCTSRRRSFACHRRRRRQATSSWTPGPRGTLDCQSRRCSVACRRVRRRRARRRCPPRTCLEKARDFRSRRRSSPRRRWRRRRIRAASHRPCAVRFVDVFHPTVLSGPAPHFTTNGEH